mmetsp:Transcript_7287/g.15590  ORF Transcript_7287/g.15590 Transcript_7287/m.15590 type:complete len:103 (-) Transcript_7287:1061-1369(-)
MTRASHAKEAWHQEQDAAASLGSCRRCQLVSFDFDSARTEIELAVSSDEAAQSLAHGKSSSSEFLSSARTTSFCLQRSDRLVADQRVSEAPKPAARHEVPPA